MCFHVLASYGDWSRFLNQLQNYVLGAKDRSKDTFPWWIASASSRRCHKVGKGKIYADSTNQSFFPHYLENNIACSVLKDGLERRGSKESGFLNEVAEVVRTGKPDFMLLNTLLVQNILCISKHEFIIFEG